MPASWDLPPRNLDDCFAQNNYDTIRFLAQPRSEACGSAVFGNSRGIFARAALYAACQSRWTFNVICPCRGNGRGNFILGYQRPPVGAAIDRSGPAIGGAVAFIARYGMTAYISNAVGDL